MRQAQWQLQTAKAQLSEVVDAALRGEPQRITRRGKDAVVVLSEQEYVALKTSAKRDAPDFVSYLLAIPKQRASTLESAKSVETRSKLKLRDIEL
jgi:antitoxin Phd